MASPSRSVAKIWNPKFLAMCWTITNAIPLFARTLGRNSSRASSPPADAPMPTDETTGDR
jgi:hypothetical protein